MTNEEYLGLLEDKISELMTHQRNQKNILQEIIENDLYIEDLFFSSAVNRSFELIEGIVATLKLRNLTCSGILLRSQIDNSMRVFAAFIAKDRNEFMKAFLEGKKISKMVDNQGLKMNDYNLRKRFSEYDEYVDVIYQNTSGFVHLSQKAFIACVGDLKDDSNSFSLSVGLDLKEEANTFLLEMVDAFTYYVQLQYMLLKNVVDSRKVSNH